MVQLVTRRLNEIARRYFLYIVTETNYQFLHKNKRLLWIRGLWVIKDFDTYIALIYNKGIELLILQYTYTSGYKKVWYFVFTSVIELIIILPTSFIVWVNANQFHIRTAIKHKLDLYPKHMRFMSVQVCICVFKVMLFFCWPQTTPCWVV